MKTSSGILPADEVCVKLKDIIVEVTQLKISPATISDDADLFEDCGVDSTGLVDLIMLIEERFDVSIAEEEITLELFKRLSNLTLFIAQKLPVDAQP
jgi:acyl carrier protein